MTTPEERFTTVLPEADVESFQSARELLLFHDNDPYGYVGQAAATLPRLYDQERRQAYMAVADYAATVHDPALMRASFRELDLTAKWQIFAHEFRDGNSAIDPDAIRTIAADTVEQEMLPDSRKDWLSLADIYASQVEIVLFTDRIGLEDRLLRFEGALDREYAANGHKNGGEYARTALGRRVVHALLLANMPGVAERFTSRLASYDYEEYKETLPVYARYHAGRSLAPITKNAMAVQRSLSPKEYVASAPSHNFQACYGADARDLEALLLSGRVEDAQKLYEGALDYTFNFSGDRVSMALNMARYVPRGENNPREQEVISTMAGLRKLAAEVDGSAAIDILDTISRTSQFELAILGMCDRIPKLPYSSIRVGMALELARLQQSILPQSNSVTRSIDLLLLDTWSVIAHTHGNTISHGKNASGTRELWNLFKGVGFDLKKLQMLNRSFADYTHPKFLPGVSEE